MAEIRVRPKRRSLAWLWVLLTLVVLALVAWYLVNAGIIHVNSAPAPSNGTASLGAGRALAFLPLLWS